MSVYAAQLVILGSCACTRSHSVTHSILCWVHAESLGVVLIAVRSENQVISFHYYFMPRSATALNCNVQCVRLILGLLSWYLDIHLVYPY